MLYVHGIFPALKNGNFLENLFPVLSSFRRFFLYFYLFRFYTERCRSVFIPIREEVPLQQNLPHKQVLSLI